MSNIRLIIKDKYYKFIKENAIDLRDYYTKIIINNKVYKCKLSNYSIYYDRGRKSKKSYGKIEVLDTIENDLQLAKKLSQINFEIIINDEKVKYYSNFDMTKTILGNIIIDNLVFIEY